MKITYLARTEPTHTLGELSPGDIFRHSRAPLSAAPDLYPLYMVLDRVNITYAYGVLDRVNITYAYGDQNSVLTVRLNDGSVGWDKPTTRVVRYLGEVSARPAT